jgi:alpha-1,2-mannosyltransferase
MITPSAPHLGRYGRWPDQSRRAAAGRYVIQVLANVTYRISVSQGNAEAYGVVLLSAAWARVTAVSGAPGAGAAGAGWRDRRALLTAIAAWLVALIVVALLIRGDLTNSLHFRMVDLNVYRNGGRSILHGGGLYSMRSRNGLLFTYPPIAAVLAVPLGLLPWRAAELAWLPLIYLPLAVAIWYSFRPLLARARTYAPAAFAGLFVACALLLPMRQEIYYGQVDILLVALCLLDFGVRRPPWPRGLLIGLATAIKLVPGVFIIYLLVTGRRKMAAVATATFAALSGLAWLVSPRDSARYWTSAIFDSRRLGPNMPAANQSLRGMLLRLFFPTSMPPAVWIAVAVVVAAAGFTAARLAHRRGSEMAGIAIVGLLAALLSPVAWIHHLCWVVVALGVITGAGRSPRRVATAAIAALWFLSSMPIWGKELLVYDPAVPVVVDRLMEAAFGLAAIVLIAAIVAIRPAGTDSVPPPADPPGDRSAPAEPLLLAGRRDS